MPDEQIIIEDKVTYFAVVTMPPGWTDDGSYEVDPSTLAPITVRRYGMSAERDPGTGQVRRVHHRNTTLPMRTTEIQIRIHGVVKNKDTGCVEVHAHSLSGAHVIISWDPETKQGTIRHQDSDRQLF